MDTTGGFSFLSRELVPGHLVEEDEIIDFKPGAEQVDCVDFAAWGVDC